MQSTSKARCHLTSQDIERAKREQNAQRLAAAESALHLSETATPVPDCSIPPQESACSTTPDFADFGTFPQGLETGSFPQAVVPQEVTESSPEQQPEKMFHKPPSAGTSDIPRKHSRAPLSEEEKDRVALLISYGHSIRQAAAQIGRTHTTINRYLKKDRAFAEQVERYRGYAESDAMAEVVKASRRSWRAAAWLLDRYERREAKFAASCEDSSAAG